MSVCFCNDHETCKWHERQIAEAVAAARKDERETEREACIRDIRVTGGHSMDADAAVAAIRARGEKT